METTWEELDELVDTDPIRLRDIAWRAYDEAKAAKQIAGVLRDELAAIRDIAYRAGDAGAMDALEAIHARASRAVAGSPS